MIDRPVELANQWPPDDSPASAFAAELVRSDQECQRLRAEVRKLVHERDTALERAERPRGVRVFPVQIRCDGKGCDAVVAFDPAPDEVGLAEVLRALRWSMDGGHRCPRCKP